MLINLIIINKHICNIILRHNIYIQRGFLDIFITKIILYNCEHQSLEINRGETTVFS